MNMKINSTKINNNYTLIQRGIEIGNIGRTE